MINKDDKLTYDEAADIIGVPVSTLKLAVKKGHLSVIRYNSKVVRITAEALKEYERTRIDAKVC